MFQLPHFWKTILLGFSIFLLQNKGNLKTAVTARNDKKGNAKLKYNLTASNRAIKRLPRHAHSTRRFSPPTKVGNTWWDRDGRTHAHTHTIVRGKTWLQVSRKAPKNNSNCGSITIISSKMHMNTAKKCVLKREQK